MYLWKYWRETRTILAVILLMIAGLFVLILREHFSFDSRPSFNAPWMAFAVLLYIQAVPISFFGWLYGSAGVGRDLGDKSGSYLFSRPRSRAYFVWCDWGFGMAQLLLIVVLINLTIWFQIHRLFVAAGVPFQGHVDFSDETVSLTSIACMTCVAAFLLTGLVFSLTHFSTVLMKHARGIMLAAGCLMGYIILRAVVHHYWPTVELPSPLLQLFAVSRGHVTGLTDHLGVSMAVRAGIILLFPLAAQFVLQKTDI